MGNSLLSNSSQESQLSIDNYSEMQAKSTGNIIAKVFFNMQARLPYLIEDKTGINMNYYTAYNTPGVMTLIKEREHVKNGETQEIKKLIFKDLIQVDEPICWHSKHTLLHDAVVLNRTELFYFLLAHGANPMVRDANG